MTELEDRGDRNQTQWRIGRTSSLSFENKYPPYAKEGRSQGVDWRRSDDDRGRSDLTGGNTCDVGSKIHALVD
jgi:hypothetical protein